MNNENNTKSEAKIAYEERRLEKEREKNRSSIVVKGKKKVRGALLWIILISAIGGGIAGSVYFTKSEKIPLGQDFSEEFEIQGRQHIAVGASHPDYNSNPPTSGWHYGETARTGFRNEEIPDGHLIHNLEHGDIWISFNPRVTEEVKEALKQFSKKPRIIVAPRSANDKDIALAAWGRLDVFDLEDNALPISRINDFIERYINKGPEKVPATAHGGI